MSPPLLVLLAYALTPLVVPLAAPVAVSDDWIWTRTVEALLETGRLVVLDVSAPTAFPQLLWGAAFAALPIGTFGALRLATLVATAIGGAALVGLCRALGLTPRRTALGLALVLFSPLWFSLAYSFMTDPYQVVFLLVALWGTARGIAEDPVDARWLAVGSVGTACAVLERYHGVLIPAAVLTALLATRRLRPDAAGLRVLAAALAAPALAGAVLVRHWAAAGSTTQAAGFLSSVTEAGVDGGAVHVGRMLLIEAMYVSLFVLPVAVAAAPAAVASLRGLPRGRWAALAAGALALGLGLGTFSRDRLMPYVPHFLGLEGPSAVDLRISREWLLERGGRVALTALCAAGVVVLLALLVRRSAPGPGPRRRVAAVVAIFLGWQALGAILVSFGFRGWTYAGASAPSLDRYLLPLLPLAVCLALWAVRDLRVPDAPAWALAGAIAVFSVVGTRDALVLDRALWAVADAAVAQGVPATSVDAGYAWDGYHLWRDTRDELVVVRTPDAPWWVAFAAPDTDSEYVVSLGVVDGYASVATREVDQWLPRERTTLHLQRRLPAEAGQ